MSLFSIPKARVLTGNMNEAMEILDHDAYCKAWRACREMASNAFSSGHLEVAQEILALIRDISFPSALQPTSRKQEILDPRTRAFLIGITPTLDVNHRLINAWQGADPHLDKALLLRVDPENIHSPRYAGGIINLIANHLGHDIALERLEDCFAWMENEDNYLRDPAARNDPTLNSRINEEVAGILSSLQYLNAAGIRIDQAYDKRLCAQYERIKEVSYSTKISDSIYNALLNLEMHESINAILVASPTSSPYNCAKVINSIVSPSPDALISLFTKMAGEKECPARLVDMMLSIEDKAEAKKAFHYFTYKDTRLTMTKLDSKTGAFVSYGTLQKSFGHIANFLNSKEMTASQEQVLVTMFGAFLDRYRKAYNSEKSILNLSKDLSSFGVSMTHQQLFEPIALRKRKILSDGLGI